MSWIKANLGSLDQAILDKHLLKAFTEMVKPRDVTITKQTIQKTPMLRAERSSLQITHVTIDKIE
jgi:thermostable 8-oxoguanine DNA glycosylase